MDLRVGNFAYDPQDGIVATNDICVDLPDDTARSDLVVGKGRIVGGLEGGRVLFDVVNTGPTTVHIVTGRLARLTGAGESRSVTEFTGAMTMEDRGSIAVPSGGTETVGGTISLDACDPSNGTECHSRATTLTRYSSPA